MLVRKKQKKARKEGWLRVRNRRVKERERRKRDGVRPEGSDERLSWFMFLYFVFPVILSPVLWINTFTFCFVTIKKPLPLKPNLSNQSRHLQPSYKLYSIHQ